MDDPKRKQTWGDVDTEGTQKIRTAIQACLRDGTVRGRTTVVGVYRGLGAGCAHRLRFECGKTAGTHKGGAQASTIRRGNHQPPTHTPGGVGRPAHGPVVRPCRLPRRDGPLVGDEAVSVPFCVFR